MKARIAFLTLLLLILPPAASTVRAEEAPEPQARGFYARGSLVNPFNLPFEGPGFVRLFQTRNRGFGTTDLVRLIQDLAAKTTETHPGGERIQVGDLSAREGGRISGHGSHQNGLDADLSYFRVDRREQSTENEGGFDEEFVVADELTSNFDLERNWTLLRQATATGKIQRMFVDAAIKRAYCRAFLNQGDEASADPHTIETLRKLRPYPYHGDHVHIRLYCPAASPECVPQEEVPAGSGCSELALWIDSPELDPRLRLEHDGSALRHSVISE